ncbi:MAG: Hsp33 family molecular chaperone HslO [Chitinophagales bacterium]
MTNLKDPDYLVRAIAAGGQIRALCCRTTQLVDEARRRHDTYPTATAALGRTLTGALLLGALLKREETVTLQLIGDGPLGSVIADADAHGHVRGYVRDPHVHLPATAAGKLDVAGAVGRTGSLYVIRDLGLKEPFRGSVPLVSGEIAEDLTYYFARSEQTPSAVALGVLVDTDNSVLAAGGYLLQLMPGADPELAAPLEEAADRLGPISTAVHEGRTPEEILQLLLGSLELTQLDRQPVSYRCRCSKARLERALVTLGAAELAELAQQPEGAELVCHFCGDRYQFSPEELERLSQEATSGPPGKH